MRALILAAGYATRLYPLTKDFPKPLLEVGGRTLLDHLMDQLDGLPALDRVCVITNHRFFPRFSEWRQRRQAQNTARAKPIEVLDDATRTNEDRLGAIGDLQFALGRLGAEEDLLVLAADNLLQFSLAELVAAFQARRATHLCVHLVQDETRLRRTGVVVLDPEQRVVEFAEKPTAPKTQLAVPPIYLFPSRVLPRVAEYLAGGGTPDAPGHFMEWLCRREPVYAHRIQGSILDIGTPESLAAARRAFCPDAGV